MKIHSDWNPDLYLKFKSERTQPSIDLVNKINIGYQPRKIIDIGCGPGNSSQVLSTRWPHVKLVGLDNSESMIEKAKTEYPQQEWILADAADFESKTKYDIVFSNAVIQWIPNHAELIDRFGCLLTDRGVLAFQLPLFRDMPLRKAIETVAARERWKNKTNGCSELFTYHDYRYYYDLMSDKFSTIDLWITHYIHIMESTEAIIDWYRSTGLKPYLDRLKNDAERSEYEQEVLKEILVDYPIQKNGKVLFPFKRLFVVGYR